jgi:hypothetical protein
MRETHANHAITCSNAIRDAQPVPRTRLIGRPRGALRTA